jgi:hypothetical protein
VVERREASNEVLSSMKLVSGLQSSHGVKNNIKCFKKLIVVIQVETNT